MKLFTHILKSIATCLLLLAICAAVFVIYRYLTFDQVDDAEHVAAKRAYLEQIAGLSTVQAGAPNILFFLYDDMGYGDILPGAPDPGVINTPNIDALANNGVVLVDFHSPSPICTPSRAAYLTGRLAPRAGLPNVVFPSGSIEAFFASVLMGSGTNVRLPEEEVTLADILRAAGYRTGMIGKWHLGDRAPSLPNDMGFDSFFGTLYSNDMQPFAIFRNSNVAIAAPADQERLTEWYTGEAISFIEAGSGPFFLYFAHNFPHDPLHVREQRLGRSDGGLYGDVLEEIDEGVGAIIDSLRRSGQLNNTLIIISSDNGPWFLGSAGSQRGRKGNTFEGGMRVPFIAHWPARIRGGRSEPGMAMGIDLLPTVLDVLGLPPPGDRIIDGRSMLPTLVAGAPSAHQFLYYIDGETLFAVREQRFKYRGPAAVFYTTDQAPVGFGIPQKEWLFDLALDPLESYDVSARHPQVFARLRAEFERKNREMTTNARGWLDRSSDW